MKYMVLIYESPSDFAAREDPQRQQAYRASWPPYFKALMAAGVYVSGAGLEAPTTATTLRLKDGQRLVQDGPFADTKEQLGGAFILDVPDLDAALDWAARCPRLENGGVMEVRPVLPSVVG